MSHFKQVAAALGCLLIGLHAAAQQNTPTISLKQLLNQVDLKAPSLLTDSAAIRIRQAQAVETRNNWLPNLKLNYQADVGSNNNVAGPYFGFGIIPSNSRGVRTESNTAATGANLGIAALDWEIYNFGAYAAQNRVANSDIKVEQNQYAQSKYQLEASVIGAYLQLNRLQNYLSIQQRNIQRNQEIKRSIYSLAKSGVRPGVDTSIAEAELSKARLNYIELNNQYRQLQQQLAAISGLPAQTIVADSLMQNQMLSQTTAVQPLMDTASHPLINYYKTLYQNSLQREDLVKKQYNPKILLEAAAWGRGSSVDANDHFGPVGSGFNFDRSNYLVGLSISYNLFDLRRRQLKLRTQKTASDYAQKRLDQEKALLAAEAAQAQTELQTARERLQEIPNQLKAANAGYRQKLSLYRNGLTDIIELNAALNILYRAETDYAQAKYAYTNAVFREAITDNQVNTLLNSLK
ncbi:TolC family protein [Mucilaginibacter sp. RS28]|uniref:TolC family protein n=1 Tax=Mucilaginibacter straminoryzae TaxID=2932774 RepID=A0A9X1X1Q9_9SPHI|nr:TolC family protein [Mucilaginibacter straminoryzae]MCJ8208390.1 TolC family protein [Mucilaginibacter straminoryzae]